jgi:hypothetical protein
MKNSPSSAPSRPNYAAIGRHLEIYRDSLSFSGDAISNTLEVVREMLANIECEDEADWPVYVNSRSVDAILKCAKLAAERIGSIVNDSLDAGEATTKENADPPSPPDRPWSVADGLGVELDPKDLAKLRELADRWGVTAEVAAVSLLGDAVREVKPS